MIIEGYQADSSENKILLFIKSLTVHHLQTGEDPICGNEFSSMGFFVSDFCL